MDKIGKQIGAFLDWKLAIGKIIPDSEFFMSSHQSSINFHAIINHHPLIDPLSTSCSIQVPAKFIIIA